MTKMASKGWVKEGSDRKLGWKVWAILGAILVVFITYNIVTSDLFNTDPRQEAIDELLVPDAGKLFEFEVSDEYEDTIIVRAKDGESVDNLVAIAGGYHSEFTFEQIEGVFMTLSSEVADGYGDYTLALENPVNEGLYILVTNEGHIKYSIGKEEWR